MKNSWECLSTSELSPIIEQLNELRDDYDIFLFEGDLGAGKTTFIKLWLESMGIEDPITSPTYSIINEYDDGRDVIYHMDCYRLNSVDEAIEIGLEEYIDSGRLCVIEWPQLILDLLQSSYIKILIQQEDMQSRTYTISRNQVR